ncbi:unnamed protein product [Tuber aestivum]|uniref:HTH CENPB-type domain-containing protein n=1 Tax=Tuber aestivum TaxID=59557 RepID=A0A292PTP7_9PEZI|nr:unnamed protein product [Tuber aestivum]
MPNTPLISAKRTQRLLAHEKQARAKHRNLTNLAKFELYKEKFPPNGGKSPTNASLAIAYGVDSKTVTNIIAKGHDYWANMTSAELTRRRVSSVKLPRIESMLVLWVQQCEGRGIILTEEAIRVKATRFCELENIPEANRPKWSHGWLAKFKIYRFYGEASSVNLSNYTERIDQINEACDDYADEDRYNFDETGLFYRMPPSVGLALRQTSGRKGEKTRLTYGFCVNGTGTDKREALVLGHARRPRCFGKRSVRSLGYDYYFNKKAWMTRTIWLEWVKRFDEDMERQNRQVILLIDNCSAHIEPIDYSLKAIRLEFLPPNTTSQLQPLDAGIIRTFKAYYRQAFLQLAILRDEENMQNPFKISQLEAMELGKEAWSKVTATTISNCWKHVGLTGKFGPGLPVERPSDPIPTFGPAAELYRAQAEQRNQNPDLFLLSHSAYHEVAELAVLIEKDFRRLRIHDPMAIEVFLNPGTEVTVTGELTDEEIIGMINHTEEEEKEIGGTASGEVTSIMVEQPESAILLSTTEALSATRSLITKLLVDPDISKVGLTALRSLRELEKVWRIQKLQESTVQQIRFIESEAEWWKLEGK